MQSFFCQLSNLIITELIATAFPVIFFNTSSEFIGKNL